MYYSYVEIEYVAMSFFPVRMDLALKLLMDAINGCHLLMPLMDAINDYINDELMDTMNDNINDDIITYLSYRTMHYFNT